MTGSLGALLGESIDYAGIFPPAALPFKTAAENYSRYQQDSAAWMLARFVCPTGRLGELDTLTSKFSESPPGRQANGPVSDSIQDRVTEKLGLQKGSLPDSISLLNEIGADSLDFVELMMDLEGQAGRQGREICEDDIESVANIRRAHALALLLLPAESTRLQLDQVDSELSLVAHFKEKHGDAFVVDTIELKLADDVVSRPKRFPLTDLLDALQHLTAAMSSARTFFELTYTSEWRDQVSQVAQAVSAANRTTPQLGLKVRTGGVDRSRQPSPENLAFFIGACRSHQVCWKATAGLHHPLRQFDRDAGVRQFGFLNVLVAATLATVDEIGETEICNILQDEQPSSFRFGVDEFRYGDHKVTNDQIRQARLRSMVSFGSCSFEQPRDELRKLGFDLTA